MSEPILGLDLGTCTCLACVIYEGKTIFVRPDLAYPSRVPDVPDHAGTLMPSAFCNKDGEPLVGHRALEQLTSRKYAGDVVREVKRFMHLDGEKRYQSGGKEYSPSQVTAEYVKILINAASRELKLPVTSFKRVVVTVPADFLPTALTATIEACKLAGLSEENIELVDEPVAAAYSLFLHLKPGKKRVLMIDLGGGTFDVAIWDVGQAAGPHGFNELGRDGDTQLGGLDWDHEIADWTLREIQPRLPKDVENRLMKNTCDPGNYYLFQAAERAKLVHSQQLKRMQVALMADPSKPIDFRRLSQLNVSFLPSTQDGERECKAQMPSEVFFRETEKLLKRCVTICERLFHDIKTIEGLPSFGWRDLHCVYLAGGGSRLPLVQRQFAACWGRPPELNANPQHAVVMGAAMLGELWSKGQALHSIIGKTRYKRSIGLLVRSQEADQEPIFQPIIPRNQALPFTMSETFPIRGNLRSRSLRLRFAEQKYHRDGPKHVSITDLTIKDLPDPPPPGAPPEEAVVTITCDVDGKPSLRLNFRGRKIDMNLGNIVEAPAPSRPSGNGTGPSPTTDGRNGPTRPSTNGSR